MWKGDRSIRFMYYTEERSVGEERKNLNARESDNVDDARRDAGICFHGLIGLKTRSRHGCCHPYGPQNTTPASLSLGKTLDDGILLVSKLEYKQ